MGVDALWRAHNSIIGGHQSFIVERWEVADVDGMRRDGAGVAWSPGDGRCPGTPLTDLLSELYLSTRLCL